MERSDRALGPWVALTWGALGACLWAVNAVKAVGNAAEPSLDALLLALALTLAGMSVGLTVNAVFAARRSGRYADTAMPEDPSWLLPMGIGTLGMATAPVFGGAPTTIEWVLLAAGSLASGFILGTVPRARAPRPHSTGDGARRDSAAA